MKSTAMSGVKQYLKPDAYKQSELWMTVLRGRMAERAWPFDTCHSGVGALEVSNQISDIRNAGGNAGGRVARREPGRCGSEL